jgi:hypothetical protein
METEILTYVQDIDERLTFGKYKGRTLYTALVNDPEYLIEQHQAYVLRINESLIKLAKEFVQGTLSEQMYLDILYHLNRNWHEDRRY